MARPVCEQAYAVASVAPPPGVGATFGLTRRRREAAPVRERLGPRPGDWRPAYRHSLCEQILVRIVVDRDRLARRVACALEVCVLRVRGFASAITGAELRLFLGHH